MNFEELKKRLVQRLDESDRGDRGWWVITRCHLSIGWIKGILEYLYDAADEDNCLELTQEAYHQLARIAGVHSPNPGIQLRRHHLLNIEHPLNLLQRLNNRWNRIIITNHGREVAITDDPSTILEQVLDRIIFARRPWMPVGRVSEYSEFSISLYKVTKTVTCACDQWIDRDEFDLFLSRIRRSSETRRTISNIKCFRTLSIPEKKQLLNEVRIRIPGRKSYQNWRDMGLHTFSLFSLGTTFIRDGHKLVMIQQVPSTRIAEGSGRAMQLRVLDDVPDSTELEYPPVSNINVGTEAEAFVAKILRANGWRVVFYSRKKGYGFDLWAKKDRKTMVLEVKSSLSNLSSITLTPNEYEAAQHYKNNYFLMMVENISSDSPTVKMIQNPLSKLSTVQVTVESYRISANNWRKHAIKIEL